MDHVDVANRFFLVLTLLANAAVVLLAGLGIAALVSRRGRALAERVVGLVGPQARALALFVAVVTMSGSLYYSEVANFTPCLLCWYQRIAMYPLTAILAVGVLLRDRLVRWYAAPFVVVGIPLASYHWLVERVPSLAHSVACSTTAPCSVPWFEELGYVTLAFMDLSAFLLIGSLLLVDGAYGRIVDHAVEVAP